jgi:vacuolar protein sorting-associated protein 52
LAAVSADIESLQARSSALNTRLENRKAVEKGLGPVVEELSVSPTIVSRIVDGHVDEAWIKVLADLDKRVAAHKKSSQQQTQSRAVEDIGPLLDKLILKVSLSSASTQQCPANRSRPSNEYGTFLWPRLKL